LFIALGFCSAESHGRIESRSRSFTLVTGHSLRKEDNMSDSSVITAPETRQQRFERILNLEPFKGLKAIFDSLSRDRAAICDGVSGANSYEEFMARVGYRVTITKQIHVADCYSRTGPAGGIKAVLPYFDIPTHSALPTLVNFDSTVTATEKSAAFFNGLLAQLKRQLGM
jgi:hypothetical protein